MSVTHSSRMSLQPEGERLQYKKSGKLQGKAKGQETKERDKFLVPDLQSHTTFLMPCVMCIMSYISPVTRQPGLNNSHCIDIICAAYPVVSPGQIVAFQVLRPPKQQLKGVTLIQILNVIFPSV